MTTRIPQAHEIKRFGLTEVYRPTNDEAVDIVFVHGLNGHPYHTWTSEEYKIYWPAQLLPPVIEKEKAGILVYGYDADVFAFTDGVSKDKVHNHAEHLIAELFANRRRRNATERPVIFVAHSLGGLVVKRALIYSSEIRGNHTEHLRSIFVSTYGILFLETPHQGSDIAKWGSKLEKICDAVMPNEMINSQSELINALRIKNETLLNIDRQFIQLCSRFCIYFFHEATPTSLNGTSQYIVDEESASPNIQDVERAGIQRDHFHMCKFENEDSPGFSLIAEGIQRYAIDAPKIVSSRWHSERAEQRLRKEAEAEELLKNAFLRSGNATLSNFTSRETMQPLLLLPFERDVTFVDRVKIFEEINERSKHHHRVSLSEIAGVGKSQIAIEYCYRFHDRHPNAHIFWIYASTRQRLEQAYQNIAKGLRLPGWDDSKIDTLLLVSEWFNEPRNHKWLMILDNADDLDTFFTVPKNAADIQQARPFSDYLPQLSQGSILITTRDKRMSERLAGSHASIILKPMSLFEARQLLRPHIEESNSWNDDDSAKLINSLEYLPLAITQTAAFISQNSIDVAKYLDLFRTNDSELQDLLDEDLGDLRRDSESRNSVTRTWKLSFDLINKQNRKAAEVLSLMAVLDRQGMPRSLLQNNSDRDIHVTKALGTLMAFSMISAEKNGESYSIHRLVQLATRRWLEIQHTHEKWQKQALMVVDGTFRGEDFKSWAKDESLLPHAHIVAQYKHVVEDCSAEYQRLLERMALFHIHRGQYESSFARILNAFEALMKTTGLEHPYMSRVAAIYHAQGRLEEAEKLKLQVLETNLRVLKAEHPDTLESMANLAATYCTQGRLEDAEKLQVQVMETRLRVLKAEHPDTLKSMNNLAVTYSKQGRLEEAEKLGLQVIETRLRVLKEEHPDTLKSMNNLAVTYSKQGRLEEAEKLELQVIETRLRVLKEEHPDTLESMSNLAITYGAQRRWEEAEKLLAKVMETRLRVQKEEHPDTLASMNNLAALYSNQGRWKEAEKLRVKVMETRLRVLKEEHPGTLESMNNLAVTYFYQRRWEEAEKLQGKVMETRLRVLKEEHPDTLTSMSNLARVYYVRDRPNEAIAMMEKVVELRTKSIGADHPSTLSSADFLNRWSGT
ncbi:hypothetical protein MMC22_004409 [Lobaria immixta]|nr:hypothetical protein [Lobaria immixta]